LLAPFSTSQILTAALAISLLACGTSENSDPLPAGGDAPSPTRFEIGVTQEFESLNPMISTMAASSYIYYFTGRPLVSINADWEYECWLCVEIPTLENGLAQIVIVDGIKKLSAQWEIRPDAIWGDGTPITGRDVELSWKIGASPNVSVGDKLSFQNIEAVEVDPNHPKKFTLHFKEARYHHNEIATFFLLPSHLEGPVWEKTQDSAGSYEKQTTFSTDPTLPGLYSGPYRVDEIKLGSHVSLIRNEHYYGEKPQIEQVIFKLIPNTQALEANLLSGNIDMISEIGLIFDQALAFDKRSKSDPDLRAFETRFREGTIYEHITMNIRHPILKDLDVRKAMVYAIDREKLVMSLFEGKQPVALHDTHPLDPYFTDDVLKYSHDPPRAKALLDGAGWKVGSDGYRYKEGKKFTVTLMTTAQDKTRELVEVFLQDQWKQVGIEARIKNEPARVFFGETMRRGPFPDLAMFASLSSPGNVPLTSLHSHEIPNKENGWSGQNFGGFENAVIDEALDAIHTEFDFEKRKALMAIIQREYTEQLPAIPLYLRAQIAVIPKTMKGFRLSGHQFYSTLRAERWSLQ
jgi:peptide/nickel transport system substrate-binding protein